MFPDLNKNLYIAAILFGIFVLVLDFVELVFGYDNAKFVKDMLFLLSITSFFLYCILDSLKIQKPSSTNRVYFVYRKIPEMEKPLTDDEHQILQFIHAQQVPYIIRKDVENILQYKESKCKLILRELIDRGCLTKVGAGSYIRYLVNEEKVNEYLQKHINEDTTTNNE